MLQLTRAAGKLLVEEILTVDMIGRRLCMG